MSLIFYRVCPIKTARCQISKNTIDFSKTDENISVSNRNTIKPPNMTTSSLSQRTNKGISYVLIKIIGKISASNGNNWYFGKTLKSYCKFILGYH